MLILGRSLVRCTQNSPDLQSGDQHIYTENMIGYIIVVLLNVNYDTEYFQWKYPYGPPILPTRVLLGCDWWLYFRASSVLFVYNLLNTLPN